MRLIKALSILTLVIVLSFLNLLFLVLQETIKPPNRGSSLNYGIASGGFVLSDKFS
jgi:hypothetical protein